MKECLTGRVYRRKKNKVIFSQSVTYKNSVVLELEPEGSVNISYFDDYTID